VNTRKELSVLGQHLEKLIWASRYSIIVAVIASLLAAFGVLVVATVDASHLLNEIGPYLVLREEEGLRTLIVTHVIEMLDGYLLATIMLIFAFGLYELFISRIDVAEGNELASRILLIRNLDDLKDRLAKVVLLILVVKFFEHALKLDFQSSIGLLYLSIGIVLVSASIYLTHKVGSAHSEVPSPGGSSFNSNAGMVSGHASIKEAITWRRLRSPQFPVLERVRRDGPH